MFTVPFAVTVKFVLGTRARLLAAATIAALTATGGLSVGAAHGAADLGGYDLSAGAPAFELVLDSDAVPVPAHPVLDATVPETSSTLQSGPLGHGLASLFWPGDLGGHFGSALEQLGQLCTSLLPISVPNLPTQCLAVPPSVKDNATAFNDPFKAETFAPGGPADASYFDPAIPGVTMWSHADSNRVESAAGFSSFQAPGLGSLGSVQSHSLTTQGDGKGVSDARSELFDVSLAGGLVTIDHVASAAKETTDGQQAVGTGRTVVSGLHIGGLPAAIDTSGLHVEGLTSVANKALQALGLEIELTAPTVATEGAKGSFGAPVVVISYRDDQNALEQAGLALGQKLTTGALRPLTGSLQQLALGPQTKVTLALGGATASVDGAPAFADLGAGDTGGSSVTPGIPGTNSTQTVTPGSVGTSVEGVQLSAPTALPRAKAGGIAAVTRALSGFGGLAWGLVLGAVAAAVALGLGLSRATLAADAASMRRRPTGGCPHH